MLKKGFLKPKLTLELFGFIQFLKAVSFGFASSIILCLLLNYSRELFRFFSVLNELADYTKGEYLIGDIFFAAFSSVFGFGVTMYFLIKDLVVLKYSRYLKMLALSNIFLFMVFPLNAISRIGTVILFALINLPGYDRHLQLHTEFLAIFVLIPFVMFLLYWHVIQRMYMTNFWMLKSFVVLVVWTWFLFSCLLLDRSIIDSSYRFSIKERLQRIENELSEAKSIGLNISPQTKSILEKFHTDSKQKMMEDIPNSFKSNREVSLDTLVLAKIIIANLDHIDNFPVEVYWEEKWDLMWTYPLPEDVFNQLKFHDPNDIETKVIFEILGEMVNISNSRFGDSHELNKNLGPYFQNQKYEKIVLISNTFTIQSRLIQVVQKLLSNEAYQNYHSLIKDMVFELEHTRHKWVDLELDDFAY